VTTAAAATSALYSSYFHEAHTAMREVVGGAGPLVLDWRPGDDTNSIAVLVSHALDAERAITSNVAGLTLPRDRDAMFRVAGLGPDELVAMIDATERDVDGFLAALTNDGLAAAIDRRGRTETGARWLLHVAAHTREHIGQATLTRQLAEQVAVAGLGA
jgi:uncharacterized damage-inducible protein DinB